jgi:hypothetical protein
MSQFKNLYYTISEMLDQKIAPELIVAELQREFEVTPGVASQWIDEVSSDQESCF